MNQDLTEEEMRHALFGSAAPSAPEHVAVAPVDIMPPVAVPVAVPATAPVSKPARAVRPSSRLRVTLHVSNIYEGDFEVFTFDASTLSVLSAELDAKKAARKKFKYISLVSVAPI